MLDRYKQIRQDLMANIERLAAVSSSRGDTKVEESLLEIGEKLAGNRFHLVVLGQFKRGKSTFINSLLGDRVLPTAVVPLTSIVTLLKYGDREKIEVVFNHGQRSTISREEMAAYVTERGNPGNEKNVKHVEVSYPSLYLRDGVFLIDTPGVGSTFENNTEMTYNYLPKVDAALFLLAVDPPISQSEIAFLGDVRQYVEKIFFIQNKIDYMDEQDRQESMAFSKEVIEKALGSDGIRIYPLSAKLALEGKQSGNQRLLTQSGLPEFDRVLGEFLLKEKGKTVLRSALHGARKLLSDEEFAIELERRAIATPLEALEEKIRLFQEKMELIKRDREDNSYYFEGEMKRLIDMLDRDLLRLKEVEIPRLLNELHEAGEKHQHRSTAEYVRIMEEVLQNGIVRTFDEWIVREEEKLNEEYARVSKKFSDRANEIIDAIVNASAELFDLQLERFVAEETISSDSQLYYMVGDPPKFFDLEGALDFFSQKILPRGLSQARVLKDLQKKLPDKIDMNCGRVRWDFMDRIKKSFLKFRWDLNLKIEATEEGIRKAIDKAVELKKVSAAEMNKAEQLIAEQYKQIQEVKGELEVLEEAIQGL
ncbi:MAG: dynamin family protein [Deltaproteobacteria bacterium]|nr:dynamin family protein [Deltaproteobacteria bacterium]MBW2070893.1 dynamin family protein [Deltaproteobacteria bacterium]